MKYATLGLMLLATACTNVDGTKQTVDVEKVRQYALIACAIAPTAEQIIKLYTDNKDIKTAEQAAALLCLSLMKTGN